RRRRRDRAAPPGQRSDHRCHAGGGGERRRDAEPGQAHARSRGRRLPHQAHRREGAPAVGRRTDPVMRSRTTTARHGARQRSGDAPTSAAVGLSEETFERLYRDHAAPVFGYLARRVGPDLAEDLTAQTFVEAWAGRERFDPRKGAGVAWLFGIAVNQLRRHRRREAYQLTAFARTGVDPALPFDEAG